MDVLYREYGIFRWRLVWSWIFRIYLTSKCISTFFLREKDGETKESGEVAHGNIIRRIIVDNGSRGRCKIQPQVSPSPSPPLPRPLFFFLSFHSPFLFSTYTFRISVFIGVESNLHRSVTSVPHPVSPQKPVSHLLPEFFYRIRLTTDHTKSILMAVP